jgi:hypothetical protein
LNTERNIGFSATVSARALNVAGVSLAFFFRQDGSPHHERHASGTPESLAPQAHDRNAGTEILKPAADSMIVMRPVSKR